MSVGIESLLTSALGLVAPWEVDKVDLDTARRRIDFEVRCSAKLLACPHCGVADQRIHDRLRRSWRHLDFFQFEAWLHADVPRVVRTGCGKTSQASVPWAREGSGFTALFEALALALCRELPVRQAAALLRCADKQLWRRIEHYVEQARALDDMSTVEIVGIDDTSLHKGQSYITAVHDLDAKRLLFATEGRDHQTVVDFAADLKAHGGDPEQVRHVCQDMSAAYAKGVGMALPNAAISYDRFHVVAMAVDAMDKVRQAEMRDDPKAVAQALGTTDPKTIKGLMWGMRKNPSGWSIKRKRSGKPSFVKAVKLRTSCFGNQRTRRGAHGSTADVDVPGAGGGVSGLGAEGEGMGRGQRCTDARAGELVRPFTTLAGTA